MDTSLSLPDPGEFHHPLQNGHAPGLVAGLVIDDLHPYDLAYNHVDSGLDSAIGELLAARDSELDPDLVDAQTRILEQELRAEIDRLDHDDPHEETAQQPNHASGSYCNLAHGNLAHGGDSDQADVLPGFEALTRTDLDRALLGRGNQVQDTRVPCPPWCADADLPAHGDGFDTTPEDEVPHRGVPHDIPVKHGGQSLEHAGRAEISLQLEQERDLASGPVIMLSVVVRDIEHTAWLTAAEATALHRTLAQLLDDTNHDG